MSAPRRQGYGCGQFTRPTEAGASRAKGQLQQAAELVSPALGAGSMVEHYTTVRLGTGPATVWTGGSGEPLLLVHGGWRGAEMHWQRVWERLGESYRVIAP